MTTVTYTVLRVCPVFEVEPVVWVAIGLYDRDGEPWHSMGAGATALEAHLDLAAELERSGVADYSLTECGDETERRALAWSAKQRTFMATGTPVREVPETGAMDEVHG